MNLDRIEQQAGHLPAYQIADSVNEALMESANLVITAPPGAGKSTLLPLTILRGMSDQALEGFIHDHLKSQGKILMLEPRRLAARQIAERMAQILGEPVGKTIGYRVRFESKVSDDTRIEVLTEGILTRMLVNDATLEGVSCLIFDEFHEMTGFTEEEVREMLEYYSSVLPFNHTVDELIKEMKPWYDNYCFSIKRYGKTTMYNSVMVLNFLDNYIHNDYDIPDSMIESNIRIDYDKIRMLIRHDKEFAHDASIIQQLVTKGYVTGKLVEHFPAERINDPDNFVSLLFYFGMLTIDGTSDGDIKFIIPNEVVRDQMYTYLLNTYEENDLTYDTYGKGKLESRLAYHGDYKAYFDFIADSLKRYSSQRDKQKGEAFVHGFTLAMTSQNRFYRPISELDDEVEARLSDAMASHSFAAMLSHGSMKIVLPFDILKLPAWSVAWAMRSG
jgi:nucleoside-triphosphatase THEP1